MNSRVLPVDPDVVWAVLGNGFTYSAWVVGTNQIRGVDEDFPKTGTALRYRVGKGPLGKDGATTVLAAEPGRSLELEASAWPAGTAYIRLETARTGPERTRVTITEHPRRGPAAALHVPLTDAMLHLRNVETLRRLEKVCTGWH